GTRAARVQQGDHLVPGAVEQHDILQPVEVQVQLPHLGRVEATGPGKVQRVGAVLYGDPAIELEGWLRGSEERGTEGCGEGVDAVHAGCVRVQKWAGKRPPPLSILRCSCIPTCSQPLRNPHGTGPFRIPTAAWGTTLYLPPL